MLYPLGYEGEARSLAKRPLALTPGKPRKTLSLWPQVGCLSLYFQASIPLISKRRAMPAAVWGFYG